MAYLYKRGNKWAYRAYAGKDPVTGRDKQKSKSGFATKKDADIAASLFERQFHSGEYIKPSKITFSDLCDDWLKHYSNDAKPNSIQIRRNALKHLSADFGDSPIQKVNKKMYQDTIDKLAEKYSHNHMSIIHSTANMIFKYALQNELITSLPTDDVRLPKKKKTVDDIEKGIQDSFLEKDELSDFLTVAKNKGLESDLLTFTMLAYTGLRIGELIALKWPDIDFNNYTARITKTYYNIERNKAGYQLDTPKNENSIRTISIDQLVIDLLLLHGSMQDDWKRENKPLYHDKDFIFATNDGYPKTPGHISERLKRLLKLAGIKKNISLHSFRHTHTALLIEANVHIKEMQQRLGHGSINTTMDVYAHLTKGTKQEASSRFSNLMQGISDSISDKT